MMPTRQVHDGNRPAYVTLRDFRYTGCEAFATRILAQATISFALSCRKPGHGVSCLSSKEPAER